MMASSSKKRTTFAKLNREQKLREKQQEKAARREARKLQALSASVNEAEERDVVEVSEPEAA
jgi:hypothetical protein